MNPVPWGGLADRVGRSSHPASMWDAVRDLNTLTSRREVGRWVQRGPSGLLALVGEIEAHSGRRPPAHQEAAAVRGPAPRDPQARPAPSSRRTTR